MPGSGSKGVFSPQLATKLWQYLNAMVSSDGTLVSGGGGGASMSGGSGVYSNAQDDFTAVANVGTKTITISGLSFTLENKHLMAGVVMKISSDGDVSTVPITNIDISSGVITLDDADPFVSGDEVLVMFLGQDKAYDSSLNANLVSVINPENAYYTWEHIIDEANAATGTHRVAFSMESFRGLSMQLRVSGGVTGTVYASNDDSATDQGDTGWMDITDTLLGTGTIVDSEAFGYIGNFMPLQIMVKYECGDATNSIDLFVMRY